MSTSKLWLLKPASVITCGLSSGVDSLRLWSTHRLCQLCMKRIYSLRTTWSIPTSTNVAGLTGAYGH